MEHLLCLPSLNTLHILGLEIDNLSFNNASTVLVSADTLSWAENSSSSG